MDNATGFLADAALSLARNLHPVEPSGRRVAVHFGKDHLGAFLKRVATRHAG